MVEKLGVQKFWEERVPFFEGKSNIADLNRDYFDKVDSAHILYSPFLRLIRQKLSDKGRTIVEVGCGGGMDSRAFARLGLNVVSLDLNRHSCEVTKTGYKLFGLDGDVIQGDAENLPFRDTSLDLAYSYGVLHHTPDTKRAIQEVSRIVKTSAFVMLYNRNLSYYAKRLLHPFMSAEKVSNLYDLTILTKMFTKSQIRQMCLGFRKVKIKSRMFWAAGVNSKKYRLILLVLHYTCLERIYGSFNLAWLEK